MKGNGGKIAVVGSVQIFSDLYVEKEDNKRWFEDLIEYLTDMKASIADVDRDIEVSQLLEYKGTIEFTLEFR